MNNFIAVEINFPSTRVFCPTLTEFHELFSSPPFCGLQTLENVNITVVKEITILTQLKGKASDPQLD